jgi:hypothetical protein
MKIGSAVAEIRAQGIPICPQNRSAARSFATAETQPDLLRRREEVPEVVTCPYHCRGSFILGVDKYIEIRWLQPKLGSDAVGLTPRVNEIGIHDRHLPHICPDT